MNRDNTLFTPKMKKTHTIYMPDMLHYHNELLIAAFKYGGYDLAVVPEYERVPENAFRFINSAYCTCAIDIIGNLMAHIASGNVDLDRTAILEPQAGGACRAGNYYDLIIQCVKKSGYKIPVLSLNFRGAESHPGFKINLKLLFGAIAAVCYGDLLMSLLQQIRPYEKNKGETESLYHKWIDRLSGYISVGKKILLKDNIYQEIISEFQKIPRYSKDERMLTKVGVAGEIYIKCSPIGNRHLEDFLKDHDMDYRMEGFLNYCIYVVYTEMKSAELNMAPKALLKAYKVLMDRMIKMQNKIKELLEQNGFIADGSFYEMKEKANELLSEYYNIGDGWLVLAEVIDMLQKGYDKILIVHPFGCLVSHVAERGILKKLRQMYPKANINTIEYDYEQSKTLRESRIMLALS
ncbi:hypothetical protein D6856_06180 [Butyrivibrio sp. XB500-5]|uniref:hypothetical protein n=1 Tax=Butyrivibrio sp. XB500-5 TaxID=2364880 RepID=UPI000EA97F93|nr:hypothetical protein [Butyrivibrio sp. XB500-5]RKM61786.1 hypothetical protein D6856_06180 [Butyrivibrio sp. XB500-5]